MNCELSFIKTLIPLHDTLWDSIKQGTNCTSCLIKENMVKWDPIAHFISKFYGRRNLLSKDNCEKCNPFPYLQLVQVLCPCVVGGPTWQIIVPFISFSQPINMLHCLIERLHWWAGIAAFTQPVHKKYPALGDNCNLWVPSDSSCLLTDWNAKLAGYIFVR